MTERDRSQPAPPVGVPAVSRRSFLALGGGLGIALVTGCAAAANSGDGSDGGGGSAADTLRVAVSSYPGSWDQDFVGFDLLALALYKNTMPYLVDYGVTTVDGAKALDPENIVPSFAKSFTSDDSGKVWTVELREGVKFPSGNELTAHDVKWSKDRAFAAQANVAGIYRLIGLTRPEQVQVVDDHTVRFEQDFASALTPQIQAISLYVYDSEEAKKHVTDDDPWARKWISETPLKGGYYSVTSATQNQEIVLSANEEYPGKNPAKTPTVRMPVVSSPANLRLQLENGDVDVAMGLSRKDIEDLRKNDDVDVISSPNNELVAIEMSVTTAPFDDVLVRRALAHAIPYEQVIGDVFNGDARPVKSPVPLDMPGYSEKGYPYTHDADKARDLLRQAGKTSLRTELAYAANNPEEQQLAVLVENELKKVGVTVKLSPLDPATFAERREKKNIPLQIAYGQQWVDDVEYLLSTSLTKGAALNYSNYTNPEIESIFEKSHTITDEERRNEMWLRVQEILAEDVPWLVLCQPNFNLPVRKGVAGWVQPVDGLFRLRYLTTS